MTDSVGTIQYHLAGVDDAVESKNVLLLSDSILSLLVAEGWSRAEIVLFVKTMAGSGYSEAG